MTKQTTLQGHNEQFAVIRNDATHETAPVAIRKSLRRGHLLASLSFNNWMHKNCIHENMLRIHRETASSRSLF